MAITSPLIWLFSFLLIITGDITGYIYQVFQTKSVLLDCLQLLLFPISFLVDAALIYVVGKKHLSQDVGFSTALQYARRFWGRLLLVLIPILAISLPFLMMIFWISSRILFPQESRAHIFQISLTISAPFVNPLHFFANREIVLRDGKVIDSFKSAGDFYFQHPTLVLVLIFFFAVCQHLIFGISATIATGFLNLPESLLILFDPADQAIIFSHPLPILLSSLASIPLVAIESSTYTLAYLSHLHEHNQNSLYDKIEA
jgi:hypothetical protein